MRMKLLKVVVVLLIAGSGDTRPQKSGADSATQLDATETSNAGWKDARFSNKSHDIIRNDSRYTGTSGSNNRKSYITYFHDSVSPSRERTDIVGSRTSDLAANEMTRSFGGIRRRPKINDIWRSLPEFEAVGDPSDSSGTGVSGGISAIDTVQNSGRTDEPSSFRDLSVDSKNTQDGKTDRLRSILASKLESSDLGDDRMSYSEKMNTGRYVDRLKFDAISRGSSGPAVVQMRYSSIENNSSAGRTSDFRRMSIADAMSHGNTSLVGKNSVWFNSSLNKNIGDNMSRWRAEQNSDLISLQMTRTNVQSNRQKGTITHSIHNNYNSLNKVANRIGSVARENLKPSGIIVDSFRHVSGTRRDSLNNSRKPAHEAEMHLTLIPNSKSGVINHSRSAQAAHRNTVTSNRNFVKFRHPSSTSNHSNQPVKRIENLPSYRRNTSDVTSNSIDQTKLKKNNNVLSTATETRESTKSHFAQTAVKRPLFKPAKNLSHAEKLPSQAERADDGNETRGEYGGAPVHNAYSKNWPNEALQNMEDLYNYEKYTSSLVESNQDLGFQNIDQVPILSWDGGYINRPDPVLDSSLKKIVHWLKIPAIVPNNTHTHFAGNDNDIYKPVESVLESVYENLEPNRPANTHASNYETGVFQDAAFQNQDLDKLDYHETYLDQWSNPPGSVVSSQYATGSTNLSSTLDLSTWPDIALPTNDTVYSPLTHVTQSTVVHILNDDLKNPNVTVTQLKVPQSGMVPLVTEQSIVPSAESAPESFQRPNVHIMFTSEKDKVPSKMESNTFPSSSENTNCPTITINSYTRVNNTIQSKEGCTDLNIIINSHISNTNVFKPSSEQSISEQQTSLATQSYADVDESDKYASVIDDLSHQDSLSNYVTMSTGTYSSSPLEMPYPAQDSYYDSQKDPGEFLDHNPPVPLESTIEVFQGTQISVSGSYFPSTDAQATISPALMGTGPAGSSIDGPNVDDDASNSAIGPPVGGAGGVANGASASGSPIAGNPSSINSPISVNAPAIAQGLPSPLQSSGTVMGQANNALAPGSLQLPTLSNLPSRPNLPIGSSSLSSAAQGDVTGSSSRPNDSNNDDDDDDDYDMSPGGVLQSVASVFTYASFLNPLGYSFFSLAAAPFAAMAAGVLGVAAFVFPWAFPNIFDFGRAADKVTIRFRPNLEEFVRQAVHKYDRLNEWKSRRRKRRR